MSPEQSPVLSDEKIKEYEARGSATIETEDLNNLGRVAKAPESNLLGNHPVERLIESDKLRYDALETAKNGNLEGITDPAEKAALTERFQQEGQKGLESLVESLQKKITVGPANPEQLGTYVAEQQLGTDARGTEAMAEATAAATQGVESALAPEVVQTIQTPEAIQ